MHWFWQKELKIGQIWIMKENNPFDKSEFCVEILNIKNGWILCEEKITDWLKEKWVKDGNEMNDVSLFTLKNTKNLILDFIILNYFIILNW